MMNGLKGVSLLAIAQAMVFIPSALAQEGEGEDAKPRDEIVVVGSAIKSNADYDTNSRPVQLITTDDFRSGAGQQVAQFLQSQPIVSGFNTTSLTSEYIGGRSNINLRGLGEQYTLVLVNGRRIGGRYDGDLEAIPSIAIDNIEILKAGASSIYGADAVAGVLNVRLKDDFDGFEMEASYGQTGKGDSNTVQVGALFGLSNDLFSITGSVSYQNNEGFDKFARERTASRDFRPFGGIDFRSPSNGSPHLITLGDGTQLSIDRSRFGAGHYSGNVSDYVAYDPETQARSFNETSTNPAFDRLSGHWAFEFRPFQDKLKFFTEGYIDDRNQPVFAWENVPVTLTVPADQFYNPFGEEVTVNYELAEMGRFTRSYQTTTYTAAFGIRGELGRFNYEAVYTQHQSDRENLIPNPWVDYAALDAALARTDELAFNPFGFHANSPEQIALFQGPGGREGVTDKIDTIDLKIDGELFRWYAGTAYFAAGYQYRDLFFSFEPDYARQALGNTSRCATDPATGFPSCAPQPFDEARDVNAFFGEVLVPFYQSNSDGAIINNAEASAAVRKEEYSDFGSVTIWQASGKVGLLDDSLTIRGAWSQSFKPPSVGSLFAPVQTITDGPAQAFLFDPVRGGVFPVTRITGGNTDLSPEIGTSINVGAIYKPDQISGLTVTVDHWWLNLDDIIETPDFQAILNGTSLIGSITRDADNFPTIDARTDNGGRIEVRGIDANIAYTLPTDRFGVFNFTWANTYLAKYTEFSADGVTSIVRDGFDLRPKLRSVLTTGWSMDEVDATLTVRYMDGWEDAAEPDTPIPNYTTVDAQVGYSFDESDFMPSTRVFVGVENLFNADLPFVRSSRDGWARALHDYRGRYFYVGARLAL